MKSLRLKFILGVALIQVVFFSLFLFDQSIIVNNSLQKQTKQHATELGLFLNASIAPLLAQNDLAALQETLDTVNQGERLAYVEVLDYRGAQVGRIGNVPQQFKSTRDAEHSDDSDIYHTEIALQLSGQSFGKVRFGTSTLISKKRQEQALLHGMGIAMLTIIITAALLIVISNQLIRRLKIISNGIRRITTGNLEITLDVNSQDETGEMAHAFNQMVASLKKAKE